MSDGVRDIILRLFNNVKGWFVHLSNIRVTINNYFGSRRRRDTKEKSRWNERRRRS